MTAAEEIGRFARRTLDAPLPGAVAEAAALHLLDAVGVGMAASRTEGPGRWPEFAGAGGAPLLSGGRAAPGDAALVNGALIHALEYDDTHVASVVHGSAVAAPLALAATGAQAPGRQLLAAYAVVWEVAIRIGLAAPGAFQARGFQVSAVAGAIAAAAAAAASDGAAPDRIAQAMGIAGGQAAGTLAFLTEGTSSKALNPGWAARTGIDAARLARAGMTGPSDILEGPMGVIRVYSGAKPALSEQTASLGSKWHLPDAAFKLYPCCHYIHPFLEALRGLMDDGLRAGDVSGITVHVPPPAAPLVAEPWDRRQAPASGYDAKWGLPYCMALMLLDGAVDVDSFETPPRDEVVAVARRMRALPMDDHGFPRRFAARLDVETPEGVRTADVAQVRGAPDRPVSEEEIRAKFRTNAARRLTSARIAETEDAVLRLADAPDCAVLFEAISRP